MKPARNAKACHENWSEVPDRCARIQGVADIIFDLLHLRRIKEEHMLRKTIWKMAHSAAVLLVAAGLTVVPALADEAAAGAARKTGAKSGTSAAKGAKSAPKKEQAPAEDAAQKKAFDRLKGLAGDWVTVGGDGSVTARYRVTAAGSALVETLFPGKEHEMVTIYHRDGKDLTLTHYCAAGNQPRMKMVPGPDANQIAFQFTSATNMKSLAEGHMHEMTMQLVDADHIKTAWTYLKDGKPGDPEKFDLTRKK
jgi:hypothetical protein